MIKVTFQKHYSGYNVQNEAGSGGEVGEEEDHAEDCGSGSVTERVPAATMY